MDKIKINKYDEMSWMESIIEKIINEIDITKQRIMMTTKEQHITYVLTLISILYKEKCHEEYIGKKIGEVDDVSMELIDEIIYELRQNLEENIKETVNTIYKYSMIIEGCLQSYFERKKANYIQDKYNLEIIKQQKREKEYISINLLNLNQLLHYKEKPLNQQEKIIAQINDYNVEAEQEHEEKTKQLKYIKKLLEKNNDENELEKIILFIIGNTYQEVEQDQDNEKRSEIMFVVEDERVKPSDLVSYFKDNKKFSNMFLENFIKYNQNIKEGRLEELKKRESQKTIKRLYKK